MNSLDELLGSEEPHATFHDATITQVSYDAIMSKATIAGEFCVGDLDADTLDGRERRRSGILELRGVTRWHDEAGEGARGTWLADEGPLVEVADERAQALARELRARQFGWYFFFADSNSFLFWIAEEAAFRWLAIGEPAA